MNAALIHLGLNHLPICLVLVGVPLLAAALYRKSRELKGAASLVLIFAALSTLPVYLSGEPAEELVEHKPGVTEGLIHEHEESGELSLILIELLGALVIGAWVYEHYRKPAPLLVWMGILLLGAVNFGLFLRTAHLGGLIRHDELRAGSPASPPHED